MGTSGDKLFHPFAFSIGKFPRESPWPDFRLILPISVRGAKVGVWF